MHERLDGLAAILASDPTMDLDDGFVPAQAGANLVGEVGQRMRGSVKTISLRRLPAASVISG